MQMTDVHNYLSSVEKFISEVDVAAVWCPDSGSYDTWICRLLSCLIGSGSVHDELFQLLSPVCGIKVRAVYFTCLWRGGNDIIVWTPWVRGIIAAECWCMCWNVDKVLGADVAVRCTWHRESWWFRPARWRYVTTDRSVLCQALHHGWDTLTAARSLLTN